MADKIVTRRLVARVTPLLIVAIAVPLLLSHRSLAFDRYRAHPSLTQEIVEFYNATAERKITPSELEWIKEGSTREDDSPRWANHFYDAVHEHGLTSQYVRDAPPFSSWKEIFGFALPAEPVTSLNWAENDKLQNLYGDNRTWQKAIELYDSNRQEAMLDLGALLHLIEDLGVPEHARGDSHIGIRDPKSHYEEYTDRYLSEQGELQLAEELIAKKEQPYRNGSLDRIFREIALFTANKWFSEDTIKVEEFPKPIVSKVFNRENKTFYSDSTDNILFFSEFDSNKNKFMKSTNFKEIHDSWRREAFPEIVKYGANVIQLYVDEIKKREQDETLGAIDQLQARDNRVRSVAKVINKPKVMSRIFFTLTGWQVFDLGANVYHSIKQTLQALSRRTTGNALQGGSPADRLVAEAPLINTGGATATDAQSGDDTSYEEEFSSGLSLGQAASADQFDDETILFGSASGPTALPTCNPDSLAPVRYGQRNESVENVKACLTELRYAVVPSNFYGRQTVELIKQFYQTELRRDSNGRLLGAAGVRALRQAIARQRTPAPLATLAGGSGPTPTPAPAPQPTPTPINFGGGGGGGAAAPSSNSNSSCNALAGNNYPTIVISEFQYESASDTKDEFVELYNPSDVAVDLRCFQLNKFTSGSRDVPPLIPASRFIGTIPARGFFLITHPSVASRYGADLSYADSYSIAKNNVLFLVSAAGQTLDLVGYGDDGSKILAAESTPFTFNEPSATTFSIERLNLQDSNNNSLDFWLNLSPNPETSRSASRSPRTDFVDLRGISLTNLNASFDQEDSALTLNFREPVFTFSPSNYSYQISFTTTTNQVSSYTLTHFGSTATIPAPVFQSATFTLATILSQCPEPVGAHIVTVTLQDNLASPNRTTATTSLDLTPFCNPAGGSNDHSGDSTAGTQAGPIRISEVLTSSTSSTQNEFVELYNPNGFPVNLTGFSLVRVTRTSTEQTILPSSRFSGVIQPFAFFLIANELANIGVIPDLRWAKSYNLARDNAIKLLNASGTILDLVGWGTSPLAEGTVFPDSPTSSSIQRKAGFNSLFSTLIAGGLEQSYGNAFDADNNATDFVLTPPEPQAANVAAEPPPVAPTSLAQTLNTATVTLTFVSPYRPTSSALSYELRKTTANLSDAEVQAQWGTLTSVSGVSLPTVRLGGYSESVSFAACGQVSQNDYLLLGVVRGGAVVGFARVQLTGSPSCAPATNVTLTTSQEQRFCEPVVTLVSATNTTSGVGTNFTVAGNNVSLTGSLPTSAGQEIFHAVQYGGCVGAVSSPDYTYTLTASGVNGSGATVNLTSQLSNLGTSVPPNNPTDYLTVGSLVVPAGYQSIKFTFVATKSAFNFHVFTEVFEVVTQ